MDNLKSMDTERQARARGVSPEERRRRIARALRLYLAGEGSIRKIAARVDLPEGSLARIAYRERWRARRDEAREAGLQAAGDQAAADVGALYERLVSIAGRALDAAEQGLASGDYSRSARDLQEATRALLQVRDAVGAAPAGDREEQQARIAKLRAEAGRIADADKPQAVRVEIVPDLDGMAD